MVGLLAGVRPLVAREFETLAEALAALRASEGFLACVHT